MSFEKFDEKSLINNLKVNYINPTMIMKDSLKNMLDKGWGRILNASSIGVKFEGVKLILIIPSQNILTSLYHLIIKYGVKKMFLLML